jgi:hypothetical protein
LNELIPGRILVEEMSWEKNVFNYVSSHQKADGGYTFVQRNEANAQDTYYGLAILRLLDLPLPNLEKTIGWLRGFKPSNIHHYYYVGKALSLCGEVLDDRFEKHVVSAIASRSRRGSSDVYIELDSEFQVTHRVLELGDLLGFNPTRKDLTDWLLEYKNADGGFGPHGYSDISLTYYALASLDLSGFDTKSLKDNCGFPQNLRKTLRWLHDRSLLLRALHGVHLPRSHGSRRA